MKYCRYLHQNKINWGSIEDNLVYKIEGDIFNSFKVTKQSCLIDEITLLTPTDFSKAICIGLNYSDHALEMGLELPSSPVVFLKPPTTALEPLGSIIYPKMATRVDYEAELAIVIKQRCKNISEKQAGDYILGYSCANDVTARSLQDPKGQWTVAKSFDTFLPYGPFISDEVDPNNLDIVSRLNNEVCQKSNTKNFIFDTFYLVSYLSQIMTLNPGDIILTGTPGGIGPMEIGDTIEVEIEGLGILKNFVSS
jgi:2-keto-4-pentenoate hydratase/2-oxohepta-3-ene-1,7-dioic acid hydratase in catechol pathway